MNQRGEITFGLMFIVGIALGMVVTPITREVKPRRGKKPPAAWTETKVVQR